MSKTIEEILAPKPEAKPRIYVYSIDDKAHKGDFGQKCESCHTEKRWKEILFDHDKKTKYPLLWKHRDAKCTTCHKGDAYKEKLQTTCTSCHKKDDVLVSTDRLLGSAMSMSPHGTRSSIECAMLMKSLSRSNVLFMYADSSSALTRDGRPRFEARLARTEDPTRR